MARRIIGQPPQLFVTPCAGILDLSWPSDKLLVGLPVFRDDASSGHLPPRTVVSEVVCPLRDKYGLIFGGPIGRQFSALTPGHHFWNDWMAGAVTGSACGD